MTNSSDWWSRKLGGGNARPSTPPSSPVTPQPYTPRPYDQNTPVTYDSNTDQVMSTRAQSARDASRCPGCGSGNYMAPQGTSKMRCYDCGYPLVQAGSGVSSTGGSSAGAPIPARQPNQGGGFNPTVIVDRIG